MPSFKYPKIIQKYFYIIDILSKQHIFKEQNLNIELFIGDARDYIKKFKNHFDIVYQDPFSPATNPSLWTFEYFKDLKTTLKQDAIITTYSTALSTRLALYHNGFNIYQQENKNLRNSLLASLKDIDNLKKIDMKHKIACNPDAKPLFDKDLE